MNKSNVRTRRSLGKESPLSKRPKLEFTTNTRVSPRTNKSTSKESPKSCNGVNQQKNLSDSFEENRSASDWDEDFSGDMLEKVCLIADLSQAMVSNQPELKKDKIDVETSKTPTKDKPSSTSSECSYEKLKLEFERLQEKLRTKEGEVHILRSQLKQSEDAKHNVALQNIKVIEEIQKKCSEKVSVTEKELESTKSKLLFKDLEYKTLSERCRQLEYNLSKSKLNDTVSKSKPIISSQRVNESIQECVVNTSQNSTIDVESHSGFHHEGKSLMKILCPEFFKHIAETSVVDFYNVHNEIENERAGVDFAKRKNYKWSNLPVQKVFIQDLYTSVSNLFFYSNFVHKDAKNILRSIFISCGEILRYQKKLLLFLEELHLYNDYNEADQFLLENEDEVSGVTIKKLLEGVKLNEEECGIEGRRCLALIYSCLIVSEGAMTFIKNDSFFLGLLKNFAVSIGTLRRPLRYNGILIGITLILQKLLQEKNLTLEILNLINQIVTEIIFARPKLDVLKEVINVLAAGKHHLDFLVPFCKKESVDSCTLYMDCKLKQAMFFTNNACPLKLLCMQIMGLACLPSSKSLKWETTHCFIKWLNATINSEHSRKIKWLPTNSYHEDRCFNVTECLLYLLTLCLKEYNTDISEESKITYKSVIAQGAVLLKRILKVDQRQLHDNTYTLRFAVLLKAFFSNKNNLYYETQTNQMSVLETDAISWIIDLLEIGNQDCCLKQNTSALPDVDVFNSLKINDDYKTF